MIRDYLNQTATWEHKTGTNAYGEPIFADPVDIAVRWEGRRRLVRNAQGEEVVSEAEVITTDNVQPGDVLSYGGRDWVAIAVGETPDLNGAVMFKEVAV